MVALGAPEVGGRAGPAFEEGFPAAAACDGDGPGLGAACLMVLPLLLPGFLPLAEAVDVNRGAGC